MLRSFILFFAVAALLLAACGGNTAEAIATGIAETQQISDLQTAAAGGAATNTPEPPTATAEQGAATTEASSQVTTKQDVNMRAGDGTNYGVMTVIPGGETLQITGINAAGTWYQVSYHNATGWVAVNITNGAKPANLPVVTPSAQPQVTATKTSTSGGSIDYEDSVLTLDYSDDQNHSVSGEVKQGQPVRITIIVQGIGGNQKAEVDIAFQCDYDDPDDIDISAAGATDNTICNNNWSHKVDHDHNRITVFVTLNGNGTAEWTLIANVSPN